MKTISLRKFRDSIADIEEETEVARRDKDGNIIIIGRWIPSLIYPDGFRPDGYVGPGMTNLNRAIASGRLIDTGHPQYKADRTSREK